MGIKLQKENNMGKRGPTAGNIYGRMKKQGVWNPIGEAKKSKLAGTPFKLMDVGTVPGEKDHDYSTKDEMITNEHGTFRRSKDKNNVVTSFEKIDPNSEETSEYVATGVKHETSGVTGGLTEETKADLGLGDMNQQTQNITTATGNSDINNLDLITPVASVPIAPKAQRAANRLARLESRPQTDRRDIRMQKQLLKAEGVDRRTIRTAKTVTKAMQAEEAGNKHKAKRLAKRAQRQIKRSKK